MADRNQAVAGVSSSEVSSDAVSAVSTENAPGAQGAASDTAEFDPQEVLDKMSPRQMEKWRLTGELPAKKAASTKDSPTKSADSATAAAAGEQNTGAAEKSADELRQASEAGKTQEKKKGAQDRKAELDADIQQLLKRRAELRKEVESAAKPGEKTAESPAAKADAAPKVTETRPKPTLQDKDPQGNPKFKTYEDFTEDLTDWKLEQRDAKAEFDKAEAKKATDKADGEKKFRELQDSWKKRIGEATKKHADYQEVALTEDLAKKITQGSLLDVAILKREAGPELLYHFGKNPAELDRLLALDPLDLAVELGRIEHAISEKPSSTPAPKKVSSAPKPASEVAGKGTPAEDEEEAAAKDGDFTRYANAANRREISARTGR